MDKYNFNQGWRFYRGNLEDGAFTREYDDRMWENVCLPHTVRLEPVMASGMKNYLGKAWYRKHFFLEEEWKEKKLYLTFEGAMHHTEVWVNGIKKTENYCGYLPFVIDITEEADFENVNIIAVMTDNSDNADIPPGKPQIELDFCYFGGLYRNVFLEAADSVHITNELFEDIPAGGGVFVAYTNVSREAADIDIKTHIRNEKNEKCMALIEYFLDGNKVGAKNTEFVSETTVYERVHLKKPRLWSPDEPNLYELKIRCTSGQYCDERILHTGVREIRFTDRDCLINGQKVFLSGCNRHQEYPYIGNALPDSLQIRDAQIIKDAGWNVVRTGHYPCAKAFADACDRLGILIITPTPGWQFYPVDNHALFDERVYCNTRRMVRYLRNHPCVGFWEPVINEEGKTPELFRRNNYAAVHEEYPYNGCYCAIDEEYDTEKLYDIIYKKTAAENSEKPGFTREYGDNWREQYDGYEPKLYRVNREENAFGGFYGGGRRAMLDNMLARTAAVDINGGKREITRSLKGRYKAHAEGLETGCCLWAGFDHNRGYCSNPAVVGALDFFRIPKYQYYAFQAQNKKGKPMIFAARCQNHVWAVSNCDFIRLYNGGKNIGEKSTLDDYLPSTPVCFEVSELESEVRCEGITDGKIAAVFDMHQSGQGKRLKIRCDRKGVPFTADGSDKILIYADVVDENGYVCEEEKHLVSFTADGAKIVSNDRINANPVYTCAGTCAVLLESEEHRCSVWVTASADGLTGDAMEIELIDFSEPFVRYEKSEFVGTTVYDDEIVPVQTGGKINLALLKSAASSSGNALCGNDGNFNTEWTADETDRNPEWTVDLERTESISGMRIYWSEDSTTYSYEVWAKDTGVWKCVFNGSGTGQDTKTIAFEGLKARFVKIKIYNVTKGMASFIQAEIYGA